MPHRLLRICPHCRQTIAIPGEPAPDEPLKCPHCQQIFAGPSDATATLPSASADSQQDTAPPVKYAEQATLKFDSGAAVKASTSDVRNADRLR